MFLPEDLVLEARGSEDYISLHPKDQKWVRRGSKAYHIEIHFSPVRKQWGVDLSTQDYEKMEFPGTKHERPTEYGGPWTCWGSTIDATIVCAERVYDVRISIVDYITGQPVPMEEVRKRAQRELEEAVAPKPQEIGLFEVMESNSEQVLKAMKEELGRFCTAAGVGKHVGDAGREYARQTCTDVLEGLITNLDLEIPNEDWTHDLEEGTVKRKLNEILVRDRESAEYEAEHKWGVEPREPYKRGEKSKAEQLAESLMEPFKTGQNEYLNSIGDETARKLESDRLKDAVRLFLQSYTASMKRRVKQLA